MDIQSIITLIDAVSASNITNFQIEEGNFRLTMDKLSQRIESQPAVVPMPAAVQTQLPVQTEVPVIQTESIGISQPIQAVTEVKSLETASVRADLKEVKSPIVGTFYSAPGPDTDDFVKIGDKVKSGQTLCIIEAMKLMNDIESDFDGEIVEILVENEQMVEYNQPLFRIKA